MARKPIEKPKVTSEAVMSFPQPPLRNAEEYLKAYTGYVYTAVSAIAQEVASINLSLYKAKFTNKGTETVQIGQHEALSVLDYANPLGTFYDIVEATQIYLELTGEAFWLVLKQGKTPRELWPLRPDWIKVVPDAVDIIKHYTYHPGGNFGEKIIIPKENIIPFKYFNPLNPYRGKGSVQSAALPFDILNFAQEYNRNFFFNSAIPSMVFTTEKKLSKTVVERFINQWQSSYGGRAKSNKIAFLGSGLKLDKLSMGAKELDFTEQQKMMRDDVLAVFKVPKTILGLTDDVNRANAEATTRAFMERVITPRMTKFTETLNEFFIPMFSESNIFFDYTDPSPEDVELKLKRYANGRQYNWLTPNEIREEENLEPIEGGDSLMPTRTGVSNEPTTETEGEEEPTEEDEEEEKGLNNLFGLLGKKKVKKIVAKRVKKEKPIKHMVKIPVKKLEIIEREKLQEKFTEPITKFIGDLLKIDRYNLKEKKAETKDKTESLFTEEAKDAYWKRFIDVVTQRESEVRLKVVDLFREQEKIILENIERDVKHWKKESRKGLESSVIPSITQLSLIWDIVWFQVMREIFIEQGNYTLGFLGVGGNIDITSRVANTFLRIRAGELIKDINKTTREKLMETLAEGFTLGEGIDKLRKRVSGVFNEATTSRADMIARTEVLRASNVATVEAYRQSGVVEAKEWLAERDDRTCLFCQSLDGKVMSLNRNYFNADDTFNIDGQSMDIGYSVGEPPLHPNCFLHHSVKIYTDKGIKTINNIEIGDNVLTHNGRYRKVVKLLNKNERYKGEVIKIRYKGRLIGTTNTRNSVTITPEHPFLTQRGWVLANELLLSDKLYCVAKRCINCGKKIPFWKDKYCSNKCNSGLINKIRQQGLKNSGKNNWMFGRIKEKHHLWEGGKIWWRGKEWDILKKEIIERDNNKCQNCGMTLDQHLKKYKHPLHVHHINPYRKSKSNEKDNLITLCCSCHSKLEGTDCKEILANGGVEFMQIDVLEIIKEKSFEGEKLYNFAVEEDESYIAEGLVTHNCRCTTIPVLLGEKGSKKPEVKQKEKIIKIEPNKEQFDKLERERQASNKLVSDAKKEKIKITNDSKKEAKKQKKEIIDSAKEESQKVIDSAKEDISIKIREADELIEKQTEKGIKKVIKESREEEEKSKEIIETAKNTAKKIVKEGKLEAVKVKKTILGEIIKLRDKVREMLYGNKERTKTN